MSVTDKAIDYLDGHRVGLGKVVVFLVIAFLAGWQVDVRYLDHAEAEDAHEPLLTKKEYEVRKLDEDISEKQVVKANTRIQSIGAADDAKVELKVLELLLECEIEQDRKVRACVAADGEECYAKRADCSPGRD